MSLLLSAVHADHDMELLLIYGAVLDIFKRKYENLYNCNKSCVNNMNAVRCEIDRRVLCATYDGTQILLRHGYTPHALISSVIFLIHNVRG